MRLRSDTFLDRRSLPTRCAFGRYRSFPNDLPADQRFELSDNRNPHLAWEDVPDGTKSFVLLCHDPEVPSVATDVNVLGKVISRELPRQSFDHWVLVDLPSDARSVDEGEFSSGVVPGGKPGPDGPRGTRSGVNGYTDWFAGDATMAGSYFGYDGPCPPWNDELIHWYVFTVMALDVERLPVEGEFRARDVIEASKGHVLAEASIQGFYYINPEARFR